MNIQSYFRIRFQNFPNLAQTRPDKPLKTSPYARVAHRPTCPDRVAYTIWHMTNHMPVWLTWLCGSHGQTRGRVTLTDSFFLLFSKFCVIGTLKNRVGLGHTPECIRDIAKTAVNQNLHRTLTQPIKPTVALEPNTHSTLIPLGYTTKMWLASIEGVRPLTRRKV